MLWSIKVHNTQDTKGQKTLERYFSERYFKDCNKDLQLVHFHVDYVFHFRPWAQLYNNALNDHATIKCKKVFKECFG